MYHQTSRATRNDSVVMRMIFDAPSRLFNPVRNFLVLLALMLMFQFVHAAEASDQVAQEILHMLDYVSVDYGGAVILESVVNDNEYKEQTEFSSQVAKLLKEMPDDSRRSGLIAQGQVLANMVLEKAPAEQVSATARKLRRDIIAVYQVQVTPTRLPEMSRAGIFYQDMCARCHGINGHGDGTEADKFSPKPTDFYNIARMSQRSVYSIYSTIILGVPGTAMKGYPQLLDEDRWSLAFMISNFKNQPDLLEKGRIFWEKRDFQGPIPDLTTLSTLSGNEVALLYGDKARYVFNYLRANPQALSTIKHSTLLFATEQLDQASALYHEGDLNRAKRNAIAAYLEGFEPMEVSLDNIDKLLRRDIEQRMMAVRHLMDNGSPAEIVDQEIEQAKLQLRVADELLRAGKLTVINAFSSAMYVLLREGILGISLLAVILAFLVKAGQRQSLSYVHAGWGGAVLLGALTWMAVYWVGDIAGSDITGDNREFTEGVTALIASGLLIYAGVRLNNNGSSQFWRGFLDNQSNIALERNILRIFAIVTFFVLYREIFETIIFYKSLWAQVSEITRPVLWGGVMVGTMLLLAFGWIVFMLGVRQSRKRFFSGKSTMLAIFAIVFAGQGVEALQEANVVASSYVNFVSLPILGIYPTIQTLLMQLFVAGIMALSAYKSMRNKPS